MLPPVLGSVLTAIVTPFDASGAVDEASYRSLCHHLLRHGSDGIVVAGTVRALTSTSPVLPCA